MKNLFTFDRLLAVFLIPIAVFLIVLAYKAPRPNIPIIVGPHVWPIILLILMSVCAVFIFLQSVREKEKSIPSRETALAPGAELKWYKKPEMSGALTVAGLLVYTIFLESVGFLICTFLIVIYQTRVIQEGKWARNIVSALIFSLAIYFAMTKLLLMRLPAGLLG